MITTQWFMGGEDITDVLFVRREVLIKEEGFVEETDRADAESIHLVVYDGMDKPVAAGRIHLYQGDFIIGKVIVLPRNRGKHYGVLVMQMLINACYTMGGERQLLYAQESIRTFFEKLGFTAFDEWIDESGIRYHVMERFGDSEPLCRKNK